MKLLITAEDDTPLVGATVVINTIVKTTGDDGTVEYELAYDDYTVQVGLLGYQDAEEELQFRSNHKNFTIVLEEESS